MLSRSRPVLAYPAFRPIPQQPGLPTVTRPFAEVRLPQLGVEGDFFNIVVFFIVMSLLLAFLPLSFSFYPFSSMQQ